MKSSIWKGTKANLCSKLLVATQASLVALALLAAPAHSAAQPAYIVSAGITGNGVFGTVNPQTGAFQLIGPSEPDGYFGLAAGPHGLLISLTYTANLVSIDPDSGTPTVIGPTGLDSCLIPLPTCTQRTAFSLGSYEGKIYATDWANDIYIVSPQTGLATLLTSSSGLPASPFVLGSQNKDADGTLNFADEAIWQSGEKLYLTYDAWVFDPITFSIADIVVAPILYQIDPTTGQATVIGPTALGIGGVYEAQGVDYAFDDLTGQILQIDLTTGNTTPAGYSDPAAGVVQGAVPVSDQSFKR